MRIVVADDERDMREYFTRILPRLGHEVVGVAATGSGLIECCRRERPDLVITDIKMPDMDGIDAAAEICRDGAVAVIFVSGYQDRLIRSRANQPYVHEYLLKPVKRADLEAAIRALANDRAGGQAGCEE